MRRVVGGVLFAIDFVPYQGYYWKLIECGVVLYSGGPAHKEMFAKWEMEDKARDFGLQTPED